MVKGPDQTLILKFKGVNMRAESAGGPSTSSSGESSRLGLRPARHIAGFSIRNDEGEQIVPIWDARVGLSGDTVILNLTGEVPKKAQLWYGCGHNPYCNLTDSLDMAVPALADCSTT